MPRTTRTWLNRALLAVGVLGLALAACRSAAPPVRPPYLRLLGKEDLRRVAMLEEEQGKLAAAGKLAEARARAARVLAIRTRAQGADHWQTRDARFVLESLEKQLRMSAAERKRLAEAVAAEELARREADRKRFDRAEAHLRRAAQISRELLGEEHLETIQLLHAVALNLANQGKHDQATRELQRSAARFRKALGEDHPETALVYQNLAFYLQSRGRHEQAEELFDQALDIARGVLGFWHPDTALAHDALALCLRAQGKVAQARPLLERALRIRRVVLGEKDPATADSYSALADCLADQGQLERAEALFEKALLVRRAARGEEHPETATGYTALAGHLEKQGRHAQAQTLREKALAIVQKALGEQSAETATACQGLARNLQAQGAHARAQALFEKALAILKKAHGEEHEDVAHAQMRLADVLQARGKLTEANEHLEKALAIFRKVLGEEHSSTANVYQDLARNLQEQGKFDEALALWRKVVALRRKSLGKDHPGTLITLHYLAIVLQARGEYVEAEKVAAEAARAYQGARRLVAFSGLERAGQGRRSPLSRLAVLRARNGKPALAWQALEQGLAGALLDEMAYRSRILTAAERARFDGLRSRVALLDRQLAALRGRNEAEKVREQRDAALADLGVLDTMLEEKYGAAAGQVYDLARIQKALPRDAALVAWVDFRGPARIKGTAREHWACLVRHTGSPVWVELKGSGEKGAWTAADDALPDVVSRALPRLADDRRDWKGPAAKLYAQRLGPLGRHLHGVRHLVVLPSPWLRDVPLEALLAARPESAADFTVSYAPSGTLFAWLRERSRAHPPGPARLLALGDPAFAPARTTAEEPALPGHGLLLNRIVPASRAEAAGLRPGDVLLRYAGVRLRTAADLRGATREHAADSEVEVVYWRQGKTATVKMAGGALGIAFDRRSAPEALRANREARALRDQLRGSFRPLPGTRREVEALARLVPRAEVLLGADASEAKLEELAAAGKLAGYRYLHLATHGVADAVQPLGSFLALADRGLPDAAAQLLAGKPAWTGRLTAGRILNDWRLDCDLATLSACRSGRGRYEEGEGYIGFAHALFLAGARSLLLSLWSVDDTATALLMVRFYENLLGKRKELKQPLGKAAALAEAKQWLAGLKRREAEALAVRLAGGVLRGTEAEAKPLVKGKEAKLPEGEKPFAHPFYWAAFVLVGDPA